MPAEYPNDTFTQVLGFPIIRMNRSSLVFTTTIHLPPFIPYVYIPLSNYLAFETSFASAGAILYQLYYFALEPIGAVSDPVQYIVSTFLTVVLSLTHFNSCSTFLK